MPPSTPRPYPATRRRGFRPSPHDSQLSASRQIQEHGVTRNRKGLRPLSQTGLYRVPANPLQRNFREGGLREPRRGKLDDYNDTLEGVTLHPTKGYRKIGLPRVVAQLVIAQMTYRPTKPKKGPTPNRYAPHIGAKERGRYASA